MIELFIKGGPLMWPLAVLSALGLAVILEREYFFFRRLYRDECFSSVKRGIEAGNTDEARAELTASPKLLHRFLLTVLDTASEPLDVSEKELSLEGDRILFEAGRFVHILELIGSISPMIGLSGTVVGMVGAFRQIGLGSGGSIDPSLLADGIWVAMLTTVAGLFVAIPCLIFAHISNARIKKLAFRMKIQGEELASLLRRGERA